jgi:hypothetical protein
MVLAFAFLWMCGSDDPPPMPPAEHGGVVLAVGTQPLEVVAHTDGAVEAYPLAESTARGPSTTVVVHVPAADGTVHAAPLTWDEPSGKFVGTIGVAPAVGPIVVDAVVAGAPVHAEAPVFVVVAPVAPVVVGTAPATVEVAPIGHPRARVDVVAPPPGGPVVVVEHPVAPPGPVVVVEPPRPPPAVLLVPPAPPGVVVVGPTPPRPGVVVVEPPRPGVRVEVHEEHGHWDHGRHGGGGPEWHGGGGGGHGHGH